MIRKKLSKKIISVMCSVALVISSTGVCQFDIAEVGAQELETETTIVYSGTSGDLEWTIDEDGCFRLTGEGDYEQIANSSPWGTYSQYIKTAIVEVDGITTARNMFYECEYMISVDFSGSDMSEVTNTGNMFYSCWDLIDIEFGKWNMSNVTSMYSMFEECRSIEYLDLSSWDVSKVIAIDQMFYMCDRLYGVDVTGWNTESLEYASEVFYYCTNLISVDLNHWKMGKVQSLDSFFGSCHKLVRAEIGDWDVSNVKVMNNMFGFCTSLRYVPISRWNTSSLEDAYIMFMNTPMETLDMSSWNLENAQWIDDMFLYCDDLKEIRTPKNVSVEILLPAGEIIGNGFSETEYPDPDVCYVEWKDTDGNIYTSIPMNNTESITLTYEMVNGDEIRYSGTDGDLSWTLDWNGCLRITGNGNYKYSSPWSYYADYIKTVVVEVTNITSAEEMFKDLYNVKKIDFSNSNMSRVGNAYLMFGECHNLVEIDFGDWDMSRIYDATMMFYGCYNLKNLDVSNWDVSNMTRMSYMFAECYSLTNMDMSNWNTRYLECTDYMFYCCQSLESLNLSNWNIDYVYSLDYMFANCINLSELILDGWEIDKYVSDVDILLNCKSLSEDFVYPKQTLSGVCGDLTWNIDDNGCLTISGEGDYEIGNINMGEDGYYYDVPAWIKCRDYITSAKLDVTGITSTKNMFYACTSLSEIEIINFDTQLVTNMSGMFYDCTSLKTLDVSDWDTKQVEDFSNMFNYCINIKFLDVEEWDMSGAKTLNGMFSFCFSLETLDVSGWNTKHVEDFSNLFLCTNLKSLNVKDWDMSGAKNLYGMFRECNYLETLDISNWDVSNVKFMLYLFDGCDSLKTLDINDWDVSNVTEMYSMFRGCVSLKTLDVNDWDVSSVNDFAYMFYGCTGLETIELNNWDVSSVSDFDYMFYGCTGLETIELNNWDTSCATSMRSMFEDCENLTYVGISNWNFELIRNMSYMFENASKLAHIPVGNWNVKSVRNIAYIFYGCESLKSVNMSKWDLSNLSSNLYVSKIFGNCTSLASIQTPVNLDFSYSLPYSEWKDADGNVYTELPLNTSTSIELTRTVTDNEELNIDINGFQINTSATGIRAVYSINDPNDEVVEVGLIYGLYDYSESSDMVVNSTNEYVYSYAATENGKATNNYSSYENGESYVMTMMFGGTNTDFFKADTRVRAYALLSDGTYVYSGYYDYSVYKIADHIYKNILMPTQNAHEALFDLLVRIDEEYSDKYISWSTTEYDVVAPY